MRSVTAGSAAAFAAGHRDAGLSNEGNAASSPFAGALGLPMREWPLHRPGRSTAAEIAIQFAIAILVAVVLYWALRRVQRGARASADALHRTFPRRRVEGFVAAVENTYRVTIAGVALYLAAELAGLPPRGIDLTRRTVVLLLILQCAVWISMFIDRMVRAIGARSDVYHGNGDGLSNSALGMGRAVGVWIVWTVALLTALSSVGIDITALVTGLGIGGVAVALAVQNILGDLFSSLSIMLDRPFEVGDFIQVGESSGTVERIGLKTTRIRSITGEELVCANSDLLKSRIRNYKRMFERRVMLSFTLPATTKRETAAVLPEKIKQILHAHPRLRYERAHLHTFGAAGLTFEVVYYVRSPQYIEYMDLQQEVNLAILELFEADGVTFAAPAPTPPAPEKQKA